jgi:hypothetical protein
MNKRGIFEAEWQPKDIILDFNDGVIGAKVGSNQEEDYLLLKYTKKIPEHKITLKLSIWGGTNISFQLGFLHSGDNYDNYGYIFKSVKKEGWDKKSAEWFDTLVDDGVENLQKNETKIVSGSLAGLPIGIGTNLVINISKETLEKVLPELVNNFLAYKNLRPNYVPMFRRIATAIGDIVHLETLPPQIDYTLPYQIKSEKAYQFLVNLPDGEKYINEAQKKIDDYYDSGSAYYDSLFGSGGNLNNNFNYEIGGL